MGRARELADGGINDAILMDASASDTDVNDNILLNGTDSDSADAGFNLLYENGTHDAAVTLPANNVFSGGIVQVVQATKTDTFEVAGTTFTDVPGMSVSIAPKSTSNKILVLLNVHYSGTGSAHPGILLMRDSTYIFRGDTASSRERVTIGGEDSDDGNPGNLTMDSSSACFLDSPSTTSFTTYKIQLRGRDNFGTGIKSGFINRTATDNDDGHSGKRAVSSITVMEVQG